MITRFELARLVANHTTNAAHGWNEKQWAEAMAEYEAMPPENRPLLQAVHNPLLAVDAVLAALEKPSKALVDAAWVEAEDCADLVNYPIPDGLVAVIRAARAGKA